MLIPKPQHVIVAQVTMVTVSHALYALARFTLQMVALRLAWSVPRTLWVLHPVLVVVTLRVCAVLASTQLTCHAFSVLIINMQQQALCLAPLALQAVKHCRIGVHVNVKRGITEMV